MNSHPVANRESNLQFRSLDKIKLFIAQKKQGRSEYSERENAITEIYKTIVKKKGGSIREVADLAQKGLRTLPPEIKLFHNILELHLEGNDLSELPPELGEMTNLRRLFLGRNHISSLPKEIGNLINLEELDLSNNEIQNLPFELGNLRKLKVLNLRNNNLHQLPSSMENLSEITKFDIRENKLLIPPEILAQKAKIVIDFAIQITTENARAINEAKVLLVGQGGVGKTSLVKRLIVGDFDEYEPRTDGILIKNWHIPIDNSWIRLNVWDFGGQEIMHATHQFFLTERSLYVLVWDARQEDNYGQLDYWLNIIQSFGGDAPVIVVLNKVDVGSTEIDRRGLKRKFPSIKGFINTSCKDQTGIEELHKMILTEITRLSHIKITWPVKWFIVKSRLEEMNRDYIGLKEYENVCHNADIEDVGQIDNLLQFLHDLGIVLSFQKDPRLNDTNVLNPEWVTSGVYKILNAKTLVQEKGILVVDQLSQILDDSRYPREKHGFIISLMRKFELCYELEGAKTLSYLITDLLSKQQPFFKWDYQHSLAFQYHYNFLPSSVISRFIVRMHQLVEKKLVWRSGVILRDEKNRSLIISDRAEKKIYIYVDGFKTTRRDFLTKIRNNFEYIHKTIQKIEAAEKVPLPENQNIVVDFNHLLTLERLRERTFIPEGWKKPVEVSYLLFGIESGRHRDERNQQMDNGPTWINEQHNWVVSNFNMEANMSYNDQSQKITARRDVNITNSQVMLQDVSGQLKIAISSISEDHSDIKQLLTELSELIESDSHLPDEEKVEGLRHLELFVQIVKGFGERSREKIENVVRILKGILVEGTAESYEGGLSMLLKLKENLISLISSTQ